MASLPPRTTLICITPFDVVVPLALPKSKQIRMFMCAYSTCGKNRSHSPFTHELESLLSPYPSSNYQTSINEDVYHQEKEIVEESPYPLKTEHQISVDMLTNIEDMHIRDTSNTFNKNVEEHPKTHEKHDKDGESDWKDRINVWNPFQKCRIQLLKRLEKLRVMRNGRLRTIRVTENRIELTKDAKHSCQQLCYAGPMKTKLGEQEF